MASEGMFWVGMCGHFQLVLTGATITNQIWDDTLSNDFL
jgi:hypothetical protein